jgi:glyoxylase-like metal-dependent hydrolase (beta-lactamase superfamily II)
MDLPLDITYLRTMISNVVFVGAPRSSEWILVDAGMIATADSIKKAALERYGAVPPQAIILTHGHFDHVGALHELFKEWDVPVYAHQRELPYLTGQADYPEPDPTVGGGLLALAAPLYPNKGIDITGHIRTLPEDGTVPGMPEWAWLPTPGHTPGHISLFRERDRTIIAGDAFITVKQESVFAVLTQARTIHGPPMYFTPDWPLSHESVLLLEKLKPEIAITGHGLPMQGEELRSGLKILAQDFDRIAVPDQGRYVNR